jgi:site-specific DNA-methyltransferase (adenine-specific)
MLDLKGKINYNPDVLSCLANLSNDEVFTSPKLVNDILDMLPEKLWHDKSATFLDPVSKSGVFLREIAKRLTEGLKEEFPDRQERVNHIFQNQLFGIAITELTSLLSRRSVYCSKYANGKYSVCTEFETEEGNILYDRIEHTWKKEKCVYCGASKSEYDRDKSLETHAYQFIHTENPEKLFDMRFDVIVGNPPYQLSDGGHGRSARPIYQEFVAQAKKLNPRYLTMIIPARWFSGGKGLSGFRDDMLNDDRIRKLVDFENSSEVFPGVDIAGGICYFLWDRENPGLCKVVNQSDGNQISSTRPLNEFSFFIRQSKAIPIIRKVNSHNENGGKKLSDVVSVSKPFDLRTFYEPRKNGIPCWFTQKQGLQYASPDDVEDKENTLRKWKLLTPRSPIAGQTDFSKPIQFYYDGNVRIAKPGQCCTESWLVAGAFDTKSEVESFKSYLFTKTVRFLLLQAVVSQDVTRKRFLFIPDLSSYDEDFTDEKLRERWGITEEEWNFIDSKIR